MTYVVEAPGIPGAMDEVRASFDAWVAVSGISFTFGGTASVSANAEVAGVNGSTIVS